MKRLNIYLAGACKGLVDEGTSWRNEAFERFILAQKYLDLIAYHLYDQQSIFLEMALNLLQPSRQKFLYKVSHRQ